MHLFEVNRALVGRAIDDSDLLGAMTGTKTKVSAKETLFIQQWFNQMHLTYLGKRNRLLPRAMHASLTADMADFMGKPQAQKVWATVAPFYPNDFREFVESLPSNKT